MQWEQDPMAGFEAVTLQNGLEVHSKTYAGCPFETVGFIVCAGSFHDFVGREGVAHFMEHLPSSNVPGMTFIDLQSFFDGCGGAAGFGKTSSIATTYSFFAPLGEKLNMAFQIFQTMLFGSSFSEESIEHERRVILREMTGILPFNRRRIQRKNSILYPNHRLQAIVGNTIGTRDTVEAIDKQDLEGFYRTHYVPKNVIVVAVGGLDISELVFLLEAQPFAQNTGERNPPFPLYEGPGLLEEVQDTLSIREVAGLQVEFSGYTSFGIIPGDIPQEFIWVLTAALSNSLHRNIREKHAAAYSFSCKREDLPGHYQIGISGTVAPDFLMPAAALVEESLDELASSPKWFEKRRNEQIQDLRLCDMSKSLVRKTAMSQLVVERRIKSYIQAINILESMSYSDFLNSLRFLERNRRYTELALP